MNTSQYRNFLEEFASLVGINTDLLMEDGRINVDGLDMLLRYDEEFNPNLLQVRISFGPLPQQHRLMLLTALMCENYVWGYGGTCGFSVNPDSFNIVLTVQLRLSEEFSAQDLWQGLSTLAHNGHSLWDEAHHNIARIREGMPSIFANVDNN
jgi:hypothetical protein